MKINKTEQKKIYYVSSNNSNYVRLSKKIWLRLTEDAEQTIEKPESLEEEFQGMQKLIK